MANINQCKYMLLISNIIEYCKIDGEQFRLFVNKIKHCMLLYAVYVMEFAWQLYVF